MFSRVFCRYRAIMESPTPLSANLVHSASVAAGLPQATRGRPLTKPEVPAKNDGFDNENSDLIIYEGDVFVSQTGRRYQVTEMLGQGPFGQVCRCVCEETRDVVAVKVGGRSVKGPLLLTEPLHGHRF